MMATDTSRQPLRDLMRYNSSFFVNPLLWTPRHLDFVGCQFQDITASEERDCKANKDRRGTSPSDAEEIATNLFHISKHRSLVNILVGEEHAFARTRRGSPFYFAGRSVHRPRYTVFHRHGKPQEHFDQGSPPLVGYFHYNLVNGDRRRMFEPCPGPRGSLNWIGGRILEKKLAKITPKIWIEDQYFVCILLALAQVQEHKLEGPKPASYISRLTVNHVLDEECMLFYEAEITAELLEVLNSPKTATKHRPWPTIRRKKILYKPYNTFADRLTAELVALTLSSHKHSTKSDGVAKRRLEEESTVTYKRRRMMDESGQSHHKENSN